MFKISEYKVKRTTILIVLIVAVIVICFAAFRAFAAPTSAAASTDTTDAEAISWTVNDVLLTKAEIEMAKKEMIGHSVAEFKTADTSAYESDADEATRVDDSAAVFTENSIIYWNPEEIDEGSTEIETQAVEAEVSSEVNEASSDYSWGGSTLNSFDGICEGPSGHETYYNLPMQGVLDIMYSEGFEGEYWVDDNGCKMFGDYIMVAANLNERPRGTLVETSLGTGIVCDTGGFAYSDPTALDIATTW